MKNFTLLLLFIFPFCAFSQITADPALTQIRLTQISNEIVNNVTELPLNGIFKLKIPVYNRNINNALPPGSCKIKIGIGSKLILDPTFVLSTVNTSNYFLWTAEVNSGQVQITGDLIAPLPANFNDTATFNVLPSILGSSFITSNFLVTNHNTATNLSDENPSNNSSFLAYGIVNSPLPVTFTNFTAVKKECAVRVDFNIESQINVDKYDIEISNNATDFDKVISIPADNVTSYTSTFNLQGKFQTDLIFIRVKSIDLDGKFKYTSAKKLSGKCDAGWSASIYPNPVGLNVNKVTVKTISGIFNGNYIVSLIDATGKKINVKLLNFIAVNKFEYDVSNLASGQYFLKVIKSYTNELAVLKFYKF